MKKFIYFLLFIPFLTVAQEHYSWSKVKSVKFYDARKFDYSTSSVRDILKEAKYITYKTQEWQEVLPSLSEKPIDLIVEDCFIIVVEFEDKTTIPFQFFPKQKAVVDRRKGHFNVKFFGINTFEKIDMMFKKSIECIETPNCSEIK